MGSGHFRMDLKVVRQGLRIFWEYGFQPLEEMVRVAELLEHSVYEKGSLTLLDGHVEFVLLNPPLRMGAFSSIRASMDGTPVPTDRAGVMIEPARTPRKLSTLSRQDPLTLPVGARSRFWLEAAGVGPGDHTIRLELQSVAIPPRVWLEFSDHLAIPPPP